MRTAKHHMFFIFLDKLLFLFKFLPILRPWHSNPMVYHQVYLSLSIYKLCVPHHWWLFGWLSKLNQLWAVAERDHSDWVFSLENQCTRIKIKMMNASKNDKVKKAHTKRSLNFISSSYPNIPVCRYFHNSSGQLIWIF